jgi:hypothetical protein
MAVVPSGRQAVRVKKVRKGSEIGVDFLTLMRLYYIKENILLR